VEYPPFGFSYRVESAQRTFLLAGRQDCPFEDGDWGEFSDFGWASGRIVHASRWPVLNHCAWIVDLDSIDYPLLGGRHALHPHFWEQFFGAWRPDWRKRVICRAANLIAAWSHPSCGALAFTSRYALSRAREWMQQFGIAGGIELLDRKGVVVYPAGPAIPATDYARKWSTTIPTVLFCGRDFEAKNGRVALKVFERLLKHCRCECVYIGAIPKVEAERHADTLSRISFLGETSPARARRVMAEAHILFHPSHFEAMATVFIEACEAGMVIVAAQGDQMDDMTEIFGHGGASVVHRRPYGNEQNEVLAFTDLIAALVNGTGRLKEMAAVNYELARTGPFPLQPETRCSGRC
jgi:glycosyltransferase involved in cell wall biosynthesis